MLAMCGLFLGAQATAAKEIKPEAAGGSEFQHFRFEMPKAKTFSGPVYPEPPAPPSAPLREREYTEREGQLGPSISHVEGGPISSDAVETKLTGLRAPNEFLVLRDNTVAPATSGNGSVSNVAEPSVGGQNNAIFESYNWFASLSTNQGQSRSFISPYTIFPNTPSAFSAGFCCDQRVISVPDRDLVAWFLQYIKNGSTTTSTGGVRVAFARGQAGLEANTWQTYDFTPELINRPGVWFDFPHMQISKNFLYFTSNMFATSGDAYQGAVIFRIPLDAVVNNTTFTADAFVSTTFGSIVAANGSGTEGARQGRTTMYFASVNSTSSLVLLKWPETDAQPTVSNATGLATIGSGTYLCPGPDNINTCQRANPRAQAAWVTDNEFGVMWTSPQQAPTRPFPYIRVAIFNPDTLELLSQPDIFSTTSAMLYPQVSVNERGHIAGIFDNIGGNVFTNIRALIRDDFSPPLATQGWESYEIAVGNAGAGTTATGRYGDYNGVSTSEKYPNTWLATGRIQLDSAANAGARIKSFWFARERDGKQPLEVRFNGTGTGQVSGSATCSSTCTTQHTVGATITISATATGGSSFVGWSGACTGTAPCTVTMDQARTVFATFNNPDGVLRNGFE
jgi:hypothetical protein